LKYFTVVIKDSIATIVPFSPHLTSALRVVSSKILSASFDFKKSCITLYKSLVLWKTRSFASLLLVYWCLRHLWSVT